MQVYAYASTLDTESVLITDIAVVQRSTCWHPLLRCYERQIACQLQRSPHTASAACGAVSAAELSDIGAGFEVVILP